MTDNTDKNRELAEWVSRRLSDAAIHGWVPEGMYVEVANRIAQREAEIRAEAASRELRAHLRGWKLGRQNKDPMDKPRLLEWLAKGGDNA